VNADEPRVAPLPVEQFGESEKEALRASFGPGIDAMLGTGPDARRMPNVVTTMMRHPALTGPFLIYNNKLLRDPTVDPRLRELIILRVAARVRAPYEWVQHVRMGRTLGITEDQIEALARGDEPEGLEPLARDLLAATDQLLDHYRIDDDTWSRLSKELDERQLIEITFIAGTYAGLAMVFNSLGIQPDPDFDEINAPPLPS